MGERRKEISRAEPRTRRSDLPAPRPYKGLDLWRVPSTATTTAAKGNDERDSGLPLAPQRPVARPARVPTSEILDVDDLRRSSLAPPDPHLFEGTASQTTAGGQGVPGATPMRASAPLQNPTTPSHDARLYIPESVRPVIRDSVDDEVDVRTFTRRTNPLVAIGITAGALLALALMVLAATRKFHTAAEQSTLARAAEERQRVESQWGGQGDTASPAGALATPGGTARPDIQLAQDRAAEGLSAMGRDLAGCTRKRVKEARVMVTLLPTGEVGGAVVQNHPLDGTPAEACIVEKVKSLRVPAFQGEPITVVKDVKLR
jgi:hypothetical protein